MTFVSHGQRSDVSVEVFIQPQMLEVKSFNIIFHIKKIYKYKVIFLDFIFVIKNFNK